MLQKRNVLETYYLHVIMLRHSPTGNLHVVYVQNHVSTTADLYFHVFIHYLSITAQELLP